jgi:hypothetical protein
MHALVAGKVERIVSRLGGSLATGPTIFGRASMKSQEGGSEQGANFGKVGRKMRVLDGQHGTLHRVHPVGWRALRRLPGERRPQQVV